MRYWDGVSWTERSRTRPPWAAASEPLELDFDELDRSVEGPVHPYELRESVTSAAFGREWLPPWRPRHAERQRPHTGPAHPSRLGGPPRLEAPPKLGPARWPLLVMVFMVVVAVVVVLSSVAVMAPYEYRGGLLAGDEAARARFIAEANRDCATLPAYRNVLAGGPDGPAVAAAAHQVDLVRQRLAGIAVPGELKGPVAEWLTAWQAYITEQRRYAATVGPGVSQSGRTVPRSLPDAAEAIAVQEKRQAVQSAVKADKVGANLELTACRLQPSPSVSVLAARSGPAPGT